MICHVSNAAQSVLHKKEDREKKWKLFIIKVQNL